MASLFQSKCLNLLGKRGVYRLLKRGEGGNLPVKNYILSFSIRKLNFRNECLTIFLINRIYF